MNIVEESKHIKDFFTRIEETNRHDNKVQIAGELFDYLTTTTHILNIQDIRKALVKKIAEITSTLTPSEYTLVKDSIGRLCTKLRTYDTSIPECELSPIEILGSGAFGVVFKPALPNRINDTIVSYPDNVTKVFYNTNNAQFVFNKANTIRKVMGDNAGHHIYKYKYPYKASNLPASVFDKLKSKNASFTKSTQIYPIRTPYLGVDVTHINEIYKELRKIPVITLLEQIQKLLHQTASLATHKYIHGDIRTTNVMINPTNGTLTIIDFDFLEPYDKFIYKFGFYNNPPEWLMKNYDPIMPQPPHIESIIDETKLNKYVSKNLTMFPHIFKQMDETKFKTQVLDANTANFTYIKANSLNFNSSLFATFDNYGLGLTLLDMLSMVYPNFFLQTVPTSSSSDDIALQETIALLKRISSMKIEERPLPGAAAAEMDTIMYNYKSISRELNRMMLLQGNLSVLNKKTRKGRKQRRGAKTRKQK
jgi:serine/threonine protein kinase